MITVCRRIADERCGERLRVPGDVVGRTMVFRIHHACPTWILPVEVSCTVERAGARTLSVCPGHWS